MISYFESLAKTLLGKPFDELSKTGQKVIQSIADGTSIVRNVNKQHDEESTLGQRVADRIAAFGGSWTFIILFLTFIVSWIVANVTILVKQGNVFDPYPFILLNLGLSTLAAFQAPIIMMSQNRQSAKDRIEQQANYEVSLKTDLEIMRLHEKLDKLLETQNKKDS